VQKASASGTLSYFSATQVPTGAKPTGFTVSKAADFSVDGTLGLSLGNVDFNVTFDSLPAAPVYYIYNWTTNTWNSLTPTAASGNTISFTILDNGAFDTDTTLGMVRGTVVVGTTTGGGGGGGGGGELTNSSSGCFIATAAYGSYLDPHVMVLRKFRDEYLLTNRVGSALVRFYYRTSPPIADFIRDRDWLRVLTQWLLTPIIFGLKYPILTILVLSLAGLLLYLRQRKKTAGPDYIG
jgi:hypothetical protein